MTDPRKTTGVPDIQTSEKSSNLENIDNALKVISAVGNILQHQSISGDGIKHLLQAICRYAKHRVEVIVSYPPDYDSKYRENTQNLPPEDIQDSILSQINADISTIREIYSAFVSDSAYASDNQKPPEYDTFIKHLRSAVALIRDIKIDELEQLKTKYQ